MSRVNPRKRDGAAVLPFRDRFFPGANPKWSACVDMAKKETRSGRRWDCGQGSMLSRMLLLESGLPFSFP